MRISTKLTKFGQIKRGDVIMFLAKDKKGEIKRYIATVYCVVNPGCADEEIVVNKKMNSYFLMSNYLAGKSWVKNAEIIKNCKIYTHNDFH